MIIKHEKNCTYKKEFIKKYINVNRDYDSSYAFDLLKENLIKNLFDIKDSIFYIESYNNKYVNIFANKGDKNYGSEYIYNNGFTIYLCKGNAEVSYSYSEEEKIDIGNKYIKDNIGIISIDCKGYSQGEFDSYYIYYDKNKITEQKIKEQFKGIKYLFTTSALSIKYTNEYLITITDSEGNIIESRVETEDEYTGFIINGNESYSDIEKDIQNIYPNIDIIFNLN